MGATLRDGALMDGRLTTHVLDTMRGTPAADLAVTLLDGKDVALVKTRTNADGRLAEPLLSGETMRVGRYTLLFAVGEYFRKVGVTLPEPPFLDEVPIAFAIADASAHYHVPLLVSPWSYTTYRGS